MATAPTGVMSLPKHGLRDMLAASATFQEFVGAVDSAEASVFIKVGYASFPADADPGPIAVVDNEDGSPDWSLLADGASNVLWPRGRLKLYLRAPDGAPGDMEESMTLFENLIGGLQEDIATIAGSGSYLNLHGITPNVAPQRTQPTEDNQRDRPWWECEIGFSWGAIQ